MVYGSSEFIFKSFLTCLLVFPVLLFFYLVCLIYKAIWRSKTSLKRNLIISTLTILYFLHPNITEKILSFFKCVTIDDETRMTNDLKMFCWKSTHLKWGFGFFLPMILLWVLGLPILGIIFLTLKRKRLEIITFWQYFLMMYQGLKPNRYYWELCNIIWKVIILLLSVFVPMSYPFFKTAASIVFLVLYMQI